MLPRRIRVLRLISQLWTCNSRQDFSCLLQAMLKLPPGMLKVRHLLLHLLTSLSFVMQLFLELLNTIERLLQSLCHVCNVRDIV